MLVLTRKIGQTITLGDNILIAVLGVEGDRVSVGLEAPREVRIVRTELLDETRDVNKQSLNSCLLPMKDLR